MTDEAKEIARLRAVLERIAYPQAIPAHELRRIAREALKS